MVGDDSTSLTVSDSQSNTWQSGMLYDSAIKFYYVFSSSTSTRHTFQANNGSIPSAIYYACSGTATSGTPESQNGFATATSSPFQLGSVTPNNVGDSVITGARASGSSFTVSINDSFSIPIINTGASDMKTAASHLVTTSSGAVNPTLTMSADTNWIANIIVFAQEPTATGPMVRGTQWF
jgi:hypothetical protein